MAVAFDAISNHPTGAAGLLSWTHTPVGTPKGILVYVVGDEGTDDCGAVTYGGVAMTQLSTSPVLLASGEICAVHAFYLGSGIPTGAQTVSVAHNGGTSYHHGDCISVTASNDTAIEDTKTISSTSLANPTVTLTIANNSFMAIGLMSGQDAVGSITPSTGWTSRREVDWGRQCSGIYTKDTNVSTNTAAGWTQTANDALAIAVAIKEVASSPQSITLPHISSVTALYAMTLQQIIALPHIASAATIYAPVLSVGAVTLALAHIASSAVISPPAILPAPTPLSMPFIDDSGDVLSPMTLAHVINLALPFIASTSNPLLPTVAPGAVNLSLPHISSGAMYPPAMAVGAIALVLPFIPSTATPQPMAVRRQMNPSELPLLGVG